MMVQNNFPPTEVEAPWNNFKQTTEGTSKYFLSWTGEIIS